MAMTKLDEEIWVSLEELQPDHVAGYVVGHRPPDPEQFGGVGYILHGLFDTIEEAHAWGDTQLTGSYVVNVVWQP